MPLDTAWVESLMNVVAVVMAFSAAAVPVTLIDPRADVTKSLADVIAVLTVFMVDEIASEIGAGIWRWSPIDSGAAHADATTTHNMKNFRLILMFSGSRTLSVANEK